MTIQECLNQLTALADEHEAKLSVQIQLQLGGGAIIVVYWDGDAEPREAHLLFGCGLEGDDSTSRDLWQCGFVYSVERYIWALDEGLTETQAEDYSRQVVDTFDDLRGYLLGRPYRHTAAQ